jgi:hypothetical protein
MKRTGTWDASRPQRIAEMVDWLDRWVKNPK